MNKEVLQHRKEKNNRTTMNYRAILGMQIMLAILGGCEWQQNKESSDPTSIGSKMEINDTANTKRLGETYEEAGFKAGDMQDRKVAIPNFLKALHYYQQLGNKKKEQIISKNIALGYYQQNNYPKYLEYIQRSLDIAKEIQYEYGIRFTTASLGGYQNSIKHQPEIALNKYLLPGREVIQKMSNEEDRQELKMQYASEIANCYLTMKDYRQAKLFRDKAKTGDIVANIFINYNMGVAEQNQGHFAEAEKYYLKGLKSSEKEEKKSMIERGYNYLADLYDITEEYKKAYEYRTQQNKIAQDINNETSSRTQIELETSIKDKQLIQQKAEISQQQEKEKTLEAEKQKILRTAIAGIMAALGLGGAVYLKSKKNRLEKRKNEEITHQKELVEETNRQLEEKNAEVEAVNEKLEEANKELSRKNKNITDSIHYAKRIQESFIQHPEELKKLFPESFMFFQPKDIVSGDFYRFKETTSGKKIIAAIDCTGHGVPGAFLTLIGNNILNDSIEDGKENPGEILDYLSGGIQEQLRSNKQFEGDAIKDAMDMAIFSYDPKTEMFESAGAYNTIYIFKKGQMQKISGDKRPIGHDDKKYTNRQLTIEKGSTVYLGTDGYADQFGGPKMKKMMKKKLTRLLEDLQKQQLVEGETERRFLTIQEQGEIVKKEFNDRKGDNEQTDDVLLIGIKV